VYIGIVRKELLLEDITKGPEDLANEEYDNANYHASSRI
jgi:hypothetical protein